VQLGLTQDTRRNVDTATMADAAHAAGFRALGMVSGRFDSEARGVLDAAGLRCHELLGLQVGSDPDATIASAERLAQDAVAIGAPWVLATFQIGLSDEVAGTVSRCAAIFAEAGTGFAVEFSPLGPVAGIEDGLEAAAAAGVGRTGIVIDCWNFCFGPSTWEDLAGVPLERIAYVQFTDALAPLGEVNAEEAMTRRTLPGAGVLAVDRFATTLRDRGWDGVVSLQVLSDELRKLPVEEYTRRVYDTAAPYWL
jgi:sugar phosphate isomerase/epimerase